MSYKLNLFVLLLFATGFCYAANEESNKKSNKAFVIVLGGPAEIAVRIRETERKRAEQEKQQEIINKKPNDSDDEDLGGIAFVCTIQ